MLYLSKEEIMKTTYHSADSRGFADHGWLQARHSFSFADYYDHDRIHFGRLRVLNDDIIAPGKGFGTHPHNNMEIITIPLRGSLEHKDSMGNGSVISAGEVQVMSAGTGIMHSEFNPSQENDISLLQIWIFPEEKDVEPRYDQRHFDEKLFTDSIYRIVNNEMNDSSLFIYQKAVLSLSKPMKGKELEYEIHYPGNGVYVFIIEGKVKIGDKFLLQRDALGVWETDTIKLSALESSFILFLEVPMT